MFVCRRSKNVKPQRCYSHKINSDSMRSSPSILKHFSWRISWKNFNKPQHIPKVNQASHHARSSSILFTIHTAVELASSSLQMQNSHRDILFDFFPFIAFFAFTFTFNSVEESCLNVLWRWEEPPTKLSKNFNFSLPFGRFFIIFFKLVSNFSSLSLSCSWKIKFWWMSQKFVRIF